MKKLLLPFMLLTVLTAGSQTLNYNNEWIDYNKTYYKFKIRYTAYYRITQATLNSVGLGNTPAEHFQLWRNGREVPLYTSAATGPLGSTGYIEFWGEQNDGKPDSLLYRERDFQLNKKWSLETDTVAFFLTVNPTGNNMRFAPAVNSLPSAIPVEPYFMYTSGTYFKEKINPGYAAVVGEYVHSSSYDAGEGFTSTDILPGTTKAMPNTNLYPYNGPGAPIPMLYINATGNALNPRTFEIKANGNILQNVTMDYFDYVKVSVPVPQALVNSGSVNVEVTNQCVVNASDRMSIAQAELVYARQFNFGGADRFEFSLPANPNGNYLEISNFNYNGVPPILYDFTNRKRYITDISNPSLIKVLLEPSTTDRNLLLISAYNSTPQPINALETRNFINYAAAANQGNFLIITHPALMNGPNGTNPINDYKAYRSSTAGGSHNVKVYLIDELVDQFAFGIKKNPLGIRNFVRWARNTFSAPVKNVLLIGKGVSYPQYRTYESYSDIDGLSYVPTFGWPASDNMLTADPGMDEIPKVPIGRISAIYPSEVTTYLNKLIQYEQAQATMSPLIRDRAWLKNVVHVIGASDAALGTILTDDMERYRKTITDTFYGANVHTFAKSSAAPVQQATSDRLQSLFQEGIGLMTYFGHSSSSTLEFNLDNPNQYNNAGKYPVTIVMGCNAGNFYNYNSLRYTAKETLSEKYVLADQRGSIAFIASSHFGIVHYLDIYNTRTYNAAAVTHYAKTLGELMIETITQVYNLTTQNDYYARFHNEQNILHGDPAIKLDGSTSKPDYAIEDQLIKVSPSFISVAETRFKVDAQMVNLGKAINKPIVVEVKRTFPDQTTQIIRRDTIRGIRYIDSLSYTLDIVPTRDKGLNKITICVDADNAVDELFETNNCITKDVFIYEDEARPVYPYTYAIVNKQDIKLMASTANPYSGMKQYTMEMDTTEFFNSSAKITRTINSTGGLLEFAPGIQFTDSTVYYWRVAPVPASGQPVWNNSSFVYLNAAGPNASDLGFNQSQFYQHTKSNYERVKLDSTSRQFKFGKVLQNLFIRQGTWITSGVVNEAGLSVAINGSVDIRGVCWYSSLIINVFDPVSFRAWRNTTLIPEGTAGYPFGQGLYESLANQCRQDEERYFHFEYRYTDTSGRRKIMNFLNNVVPNGHYVVIRNTSLNSIYNFPEAFIDKWKADTTLYGSGNSLYHLLKNQGFSTLDSFYRTRPFAIVYKKNDPSFTPGLLMGDGMYDNPTLSVDCPTVDTVGWITSPVFGPAKAWRQLKWRGSGDVTDKATVDVIGIKNDGTESVLFNGITTAQQNFDVSSINASVYPNVKLKLRTADSLNFTPYQLRYWRITYDPVPEGAIAPNLYVKAKDTMEVGEPLDYKVAFKNVSEVPFDSLKVKFVITDKNNVPHIIPIPKRRPLLVNDTLQLGGLVSTGTLAGVNTMYLEANPDSDQPEQYHFNNYAFRNVYIKPDSLNPLLDVTFDGQHILNRDIVSSKPDIVVKLQDEAKWLVLDDTSLVNLQVRYPNGSLRRFYFNNDTLRFTAAGQAPNPSNVATINFKPYFTQDGEYELIVTGKDKSSNVSGSRNNIEYRVMFEVINKPMISNMLNYPNPFTSSTAFVFTITGSEVPQNLKIEIMTITGKIVREITKAELGNLRIGRNITDFKWDGTDQFGQKLGNGIYLYRVVTNLNGKSLDKYQATDDHTDKYFNKGYGKMYLMR
jgi:hypothetical protein